MSSTIENLAKRGVITPPDFVVSNTMYETVMGSVAFGVDDEFSDYDTMGFCIPPKHVVFPHTAGHIDGFGRQKQTFKVYQKHHVQADEKEYDFNIYNIVHYFHLCMENNPNMVDSLYTPRECVLHSTRVSEMVRDQRDLFLHKGAWHRYKGYAYSQLHKMGGKQPEPGSKRDKIRQKYGYDVKFAYHVVRLLYEVEMILQDGTIDLRRNREHLKAIRRGDVDESDVRQWAADKERFLERLYESSTLRHSPDERAIKDLLLHCLEDHYGNLDAVVGNPDSAMVALAQISEIAGRVVNNGL
jgi:uncharacterized protein